MKELRQLAEAIEEIKIIARDFGLDFFDMRFEICPADILYTIGAYGMPTRFSHWSFGKRFHKQKMMYDYNLSRIYELVINSDPCYAFLLEGNTLIQNKLIIAHVYAHCDFFKHNARFAHTNRQMLESMSQSAERILQYEYKFGRAKVEAFLDAVLAIQEHIDPYQYIKRCERKQERTAPKSEFEDLWKLDQVERDSSEEQTEPVSKSKVKPQKDLLMFLLQHNARLEDWQQDIIATARDEMLYFWPQVETKIMNEGWASYWHARILRELNLTEDEAIEFAKLHASVIQPSPYSINPYFLGLKLWEDIEQRYGTERMFEIRATEGDISFLRNYLTKEFLQHTDTYLYKKVGYQWQITDTDFEQVRDGLVSNMVNGGFPVIEACEADYNGNGELYLVHRFEGIELDIKYLEKTLQHVYHLWGRTVHLETVIDNNGILFTYNGERNTKKLL